MTGRAADLGEHRPAELRFDADLADRGLKAVEQVVLQVVDDRDRDLVALAVRVAVLGRRADRRRRESIDAPVEHHARRRRDPRAARRAQQIDVGRLHPHLGLELADDHLADRDRAALRQERPHAQIGGDPLEARIVDVAAGTNGDLAVAQPLLGEHPHRLRHARAAREGDRVGADGAQLGGDLVGEHLLQAQAEQVGRVAAVGAGEGVAAVAGRAARATVAPGAGIGETGADVRIGGDVARALVVPQPLAQQELALKDLPPAPDRAEGIAADDVQRRAGGDDVTAPRADLAGEGLVDPFVDEVRRLKDVAQLRVRDTGEGGEASDDRRCAQAEEKVDAGSPEESADSESDEGLLEPHETTFLSPRSSASQRRLHAASLLDGAAGLYRDSGAAERASTAAPPTESPAPLPVTRPCPEPRPGASSAASTGPALKF